MKKLLLFFSLFFFLLFFSACNLELPGEIKIEGDVSSSFPANIEIGSLFASLLVDGFDNTGGEISIIPCVNTPYQTYIIYMNLFYDEFDLGGVPSAPVLPSFPGMDIDAGDFTGGYLTLDADKNLINPDKPVTIPLSGLGDTLEGFEFTGHIAKLYFSGSDILEKLSIEITINGESTVIPSKITAGGNPTIENSKSGWTEWGGADSEYNGFNPPSGGFEIEIALDGTDTDVAYRAFIPQGTTLDIQDFKEGEINIEVVIWFPIQLKAVQDDAVIIFPEGALFYENQDLFGRDDPWDDNPTNEYIQSVMLEIQFNNNPFTGGMLIIFNSCHHIPGYNDVCFHTGDPIVFNGYISDYRFIVPVDSEILKKINAPVNWPFTPNFKMAFNQGAIIKLPRIFTAGSLNFTASISYTQNF